MRFNLSPRRVAIAAVVVGGAMVLSGCYESDSSIISASDSILPIKTGKYCQYDFTNSTRSWDSTCNDVTVSAGANNSYTVENHSADTVYTVRIDGKPIGSGSYDGQYIAEACWDDKDGKGCYVGMVMVEDNKNFQFVMPSCNSDASDYNSDTDACDVKSVDEARTAFESAGFWDTDDLRKYVWQSDS